ncbi:hypothetical protein TVAG_013750 [Trichomonas vaginalis G3]|uniref:Uncharacterized protein n=1 Tax=Trichomonas vaginalis (strain ATCC PRA-98 / G3) TaxID=412133 RepID=A2DDD1_TRIV3|nr:hypothetical protein TVAGG3_0986580 [Trichomonas vaginalis G3]EAY21610.1 hypothetical protein TVAG_013750 [Trichomonas vaginalis G3]KAI5489714.1 hypothetical protein TVAGG3_0986580 [Trichomonas vaginalis G3]|eukprot:XP_001582596.1 hypothetical protein [Trichomonas vaginalis G3]
MTAFAKIIEGRACKVHTFSLKITSFRTQKQSQMEALQTQGQALIAERQRAIDEINAKIDDAERRLATMRSKVSLKYQELGQLIKAQEAKAAHEEEEEDDNNDIQEIIESNKKEIESCREQNKIEIKSLMEEYMARTKAAEKWAREHIEVLKHEKEEELSALEEELKQARKDYQKSASSSTVNLNKVREQSMKASKEHKKRIKYLQEQISSRLAQSRSEVRDIKAKINETLSTIEMRELEHQISLHKLEDEMSEREKCYNEYLNALNSQYSAAKKHIERSMESAVYQAQAAASVQKRLERFHEKQLQISRSDKEKLRQSVGATKTQSNITIQQTSDIAAKVQEIKRQYEDTERDDMIILDQINELETENKQLEAELKQLQVKVYGEPEEEN